MNNPALERWAAPGSVKGSVKETIDPEGITTSRGSSRASSAHKTSSETSSGRGSARKTRSSWNKKDDRALDEIMGFGLENNVLPSQFPPPNEVLTIIGPAGDDVSISTIADDSVKEACQRGLKTPEKVKHKIDNEDNITVPETPEKSDIYKFDKAHDSGSSCSRRLRIMIVLAAVFAVILLGGIAILAARLYQMRNVTEDDKTSLFEPTEKKTFFDFSGADQPLTLGPSALRGGTSSPTTAPTSTPTLALTDAPTAASTVSVSDKLYAILHEASPNSDLNSTESAAKKVLDWLAADPQLEEYSNQKIIQRFAVGTFFRSVSTISFPNTWMTYTDECSWEITKASHTLCGMAGKARNLILENIGLQGTLAPEISLLTNLELIQFTENNLIGEIPSEIGLLSGLDRLILKRNSFQGEVPTEIGLMSKLSTLRLGSNQLNGTIPATLGQMTKLVNLELSNNQFTGSIPSQLGFASNLRHLALRGNPLTGVFPFVLANVPLTTVTIEETNITGEIPAVVCATDTLDWFVVDCEFVECSCCQGCVMNDTDSNVTYVESEMGIQAPGNVTSNETTTGNTTLVDNATATVSPGNETPDITTDNTTLVDNATATVSPGNVTSDLNATGTVPPGNETSDTTTDNPTIVDSVASAVNNTEYDDNATATIPTLNNTDDKAGSSTFPVQSCAYVQTGSTCYSTTDTIDVDIFNCIPDQYDLIGLYPVDGTDVNFQQAFFWVRACAGAESCSGEFVDGTLDIENREPQPLGEAIPWPFPARDYKLYLLKLLPSGKIDMIAGSESFTVADQCS